MNNVKILLLWALSVPLMASTDQLDPFYAIRSMICVYDGSLVGLPEVRVSLIDKGWEVSVKGLSPITVRGVDFDTEFDVTHVPEVTGASNEGNPCVAVYVKTWAPVGGFFIYLMDKEAWAYSASDAGGWVDLISKKKLDKRPDKLGLLFKKLESLSPQSKPRSEPGMASQSTVKTSVPKSE